MPESDWTQFIPDLVITVIGVMFAIIAAGIIAYFKSERFKTWLNKLLAKFTFGLKWLVEKWHFFLPLGIFIILGTLALRIYTDWNIVALSFTCYMIGLLGWGLSNRHQILRVKNKGTTTRFLPITLPPGIGNSYFESRFIDPPSGENISGKVRFDLQPKSLIFDSNEQIRFSLLKDDGGIGVEFQLTKPINKIASAYFLINSGNSKRIYENEKVGEIELIFKDAPPIITKLVLGKNIREWCPGNVGDYVRETNSPDTILGVWKGLSKQGANAIIDCLKIPIYDCMRNNFLEKIVFVHKSTPKPQDTMGVHFSVFGVSLEIYQDL